MKYVVGGHWTTVPDGWEILNESDQDLTKPLKWTDNSVDVLFSCHVFEHLPFEGGIFYLKEAYRVLKPEGIIRTVAPFCDQLIRFEIPYTWNDSPTLKRDYVETSLAPYYPEHKAALNELGIDFAEHGLPFFLDSLLKKHNHQFVWSSHLMANVLKSIGFSEVIIDLPKRSKFDKDNCLERAYRGISNIAGLSGPFDPESLVVEAKK